MLLRKDSCNFFRDVAPSVVQEIRHIMVSMVRVELSTLAVARVSSPSREKVVSRVFTAHGQLVRSPRTSKCKVSTDPSPMNCGPFRAAGTVI